MHLAVANATKMQRTPIDDRIIQGLQNTADTYLAEGILTRKIDVSTGFDKRFNASRAEIAQAAAR
ncbi:hypothetical protein ALO94_200795 [Pseudomonas syringae pv. spinaceae]|uniref:Beta-lactamase n=1 Tax=Pseudomonas syringae pv. spinaceae TaxID=264459 RepID=A0A0Q0AMR4_PSESX|nr:hypothetical protein ALO94_200795 [Pseudomonas syringae pv. spinaceae]